eukprot:8317461-Ditylum_brightwellii.AAC.1
MTNNISPCVAKWCKAFAYNFTIELLYSCNTKKKAAFRLVIVDESFGLGVTHVGSGGFGVRRDGSNSGRITGMGFVASYGGSRRGGVELTATLDDCYL